MQHKILVIGIDGANWNLIKPWLEEGELPNINKIVKGGVWADSKSYPPPTTQPNWKCYSTGKNPGKLGVYWWEQINKNRKGMNIPDSRSFKSKEIFDYIGENGLKVGVINMPTTYPPKKINGFLIAGGPDAGTNNYTYPSDLQHYLEEKFNYKVFPQARHKSREWIEETLMLIESRFKVAEEFIHKVDFLHLTIFYINILQHTYYQGEPTKRGWEIIDAYLGKFLDENLNIVLMSDHGCSAIDTVFYINTWLEREGYLRLKRSFYQGLYKIGINSNRLYWIADKLKIKSIAKKVIPSSFYSQLPAESGIVEKDAKMRRVDWDASNVIASGQGPIYLLSKSTYNNLEDELIAKLSKLKSPFTGEKIAKKIYRKGEIYFGEYMDVAPDIIFEQGKGIHTDGGVGSPDIFKPSSAYWKAENVLEGLFAAYGPDVKQGGKIDQIKIVDIAPTILHWLNIEVPSDMDGRILKEIFVEGSAPVEREIKYKEVKQEEVISAERSEEEESLVRKRLQELGYLS